MNLENDKAMLIFKWNKIKIDIQMAPEKDNLYFYEKEIWWISLGSNIGDEEDGKRGSAIISQIRIISSKRFVRKIGSLDGANFKNIRQKIRGLI